MISSSSNLSFSQCSESNENFLNNSIYNKKNPIELITFKNQIAYGFRGIPKLSFELVSSDSDIRLNALAFLTKLLHKPEHAAMGISYNITDILLLIVKDDSVIEKRLATSCLYILASTYIGAHSLVTQKSFYILKEELHKKDEPTRKNIYEIFERICSKDLDGVKLFIESNLYQKLLIKLKKEKYELQLIILNILYYCTLRGKPPYIPDTALKINSMETFSEFLEPHIPTQLKVAAEKCIMALCHYSTAKIHACEIDIIPKLVKLLTHRKRDVRACAAGALMNISIDDDAKKIINKTDAINHLLNVLKDDNQDSILFSLKTLTNLSEDYPARSKLLNKLGNFEIFLNHPNTHVVAAAKQAINIIKWKP